MLTILAPAKVNLTIEVLGERPDGFHEICSVAQTISFSDRLHFEAGAGLEFRCSHPGWLPGESLVPKAADLLQKVTGHLKGAVVTLDKRIPLVSGLGGDSSDAAATLCGLNRFWELGLSLKELLGLATQLGSDVPFFLYGGTARLESRGEVITPLPPLPKMWLVLMLPPVPRETGKTGRLYASLRTERYTDGEITRTVVNQLTRGEEVKLSGLFNVFDGVARDCFIGLSAYWEQFLRSGAKEVHLAGSGPALFTLTRDRTMAERIFQSLRRQKLEAYLAHTLNAEELHSMNSI